MSVLFKALQAPEAGPNDADQAGGKQKPFGRRGANKATVPLDPAAQEFAAQALPGGYLRRKRRRRVRLLLGGLFGGLLIGSSALFALDLFLQAERKNTADWPLIGPFMAVLQPDPAVVPPLSERLPRPTDEAAEPPPPEAQPGDGADSLRKDSGARDSKASGSNASRAGDGDAAADEQSAMAGALGEVRAPAPAPAPKPPPAPNTAGTATAPPDSSVTRVQHDGGTNLAIARAVRVNQPGTAKRMSAPANRLGTHRRANNALRAGDAQRAAALYGSLLDQVPDDTTALFGLATALQRLGQTAEAQRSYEALLAQEPDNAEALSNLIALIGAREPAAALVQFEALALDFPDNAAIRAQLSRLYAKTGRQADALSAARRAAEIAPDNLFYQHNLAVLLDSAGRGDAASAAYRTVLEMAASGDAAGQALPLAQIRERLRYLAR